MILVSITLAYANLDKTIATIRENVDGKIAVIMTEIKNLKEAVIDIRSRGSPP